MLIVTDFAAVFMSLAVHYIVFTLCSGLADPAGENPHPDPGREDPHPYPGSEGPHPYPGR